jgi:hypothetical protein
VDATAGIGYTFFATLAILYFMKLVVYLFRHYFTSHHTGWWATTDFDEQYFLEDRFQATELQRWTAPTNINGYGPNPQVQVPQSVSPQHPAPVQASLPLVQASPPSVLPTP